jgi:maleate cis-trans isomerase
MGLVTLEADLTIETELRHFIGDAVGTDIGHGQPPTILHSRIACDDQVTVENLTAMKNVLPMRLRFFRQVIILTLLAMAAPRHHY